MSIYKPCDIRGHAEAELTPELYLSWGRTLGRQVEPRAKFVVGGDIRGSTPQFLAALAQGLCTAGVDVVDLGILPTPMIYYARRRLRAAGCAIVTASHNPAEINGLKWMVGDHPPTQEQVDALRRGVETAGSDSSDRQRSTPRRIDVSFDYVGWLQETFVADDPVELRVVVDPMHGCCACRARRYLQAVFPHALVSAIRDTPEADFTGFSPDCSRPEQLEELCKAVDHERADLGIALDGDGDRVAFVDNQAMVLTAEEATLILLESYGSQVKGESFVYDLKFSDRVAEKASQLGAEPLVERSGHTFIRSRMLRTAALFGAEISGHYFFRALGGGDDGLFAACRMIDYLARSGKTLAQLQRGCPAVFMTSDLRVPIEPQDHAAVIDHVQATWLQYPHRLTDGVRIDFPDGWALVRSSVTESALTFRFEAWGWAALDELVWRFCDALPHVGDALWARYEEAMGKQYHHQ